MLFEELNDFRDWSVDRAAFLAQGLLAVEAAFGFGNYVQRHVVIPPQKVNILVDGSIISREKFV